VTQHVRARDEPATVRPNCRHVLVVGGTQVPRVELARCRVGCDDDLMAAWLNRAALMLLSGPTARVGCQLVRLYGMGNRRPTRRSGRVHVSGSRHVVRFASWSEAESARVNKQLVVRGGDLSCEAENGRRGFPLVGNLSEKLSTSREQEVLPVMVLTRVLSPPRLEPCPSHCQWCQKTPPQERLSRRQWGSNLGPRQLSI
jgi:hypothetical protein